MTPLPCAISAAASGRPRRPTVASWALTTAHRGESDDSQARERGHACPSAERPPHTRADSRLPLKRQRKAGVRDEDGRIIAFPYMPRVACRYPFR